MSPSFHKRKWYDFIVILCKKEVNEKKKADRQKRSALLYQLLSFSTRTHGTYWLDTLLPFISSTSFSADTCPTLYGSWEREVMRQPPN